MSDSEVSSEFEYSASFLKILMPGFIFTTLTSVLLISNYPQFGSIFRELITKSFWSVLPLGAIFIITSTISGLMISVLNIPLTMMLEGYYLQHYKKFYLIRILSDYLQEKQWSKYISNRKNYDSLAYSNIYFNFSHCLYEKTKNPNINDDELKKCLLPTDLGNVFRSMEIYPQWKYGMDGVFFWNRILLILSEENKKTIDKSRAYVDMFVSITWIFFFAAIIYLIISIYIKNYIFLAFSIFLMLSSIGSYKMSVKSALKFGNHVRSIFDLYRDELWNKIKNIQFIKLDSISERERWDEVFRYLWFYDVIQCETCGRFYGSEEEHVCRKKI